MPNATTRAHSLSQSRINNTFVSLGIFVLKFSIEHPRHDFHILMRVCAEASARANNIVIANEKQPMMSVVGIIMGPEAKAVIRLEPRDRCAKTLL
jgi:hypothetical protein